MIFGYVANAEQTSESLLGIEVAFIWAPIVVFVLAAVPMFFYRKYEAQESQIIQELAKRTQDKANA